LTEEPWLMPTHPNHHGITYSFFYHGLGWSSYHEGTYHHRVPRTMTARITEKLDGASQYPWIRYFSLYYCQALRIMWPDVCVISCPFLSLREKMKPPYICVSIHIYMYYVRRCVCVCCVSVHTHKYCHSICVHTHWPQALYRSRMF
jgi:hypothetical protein